MEISAKRKHTKNLKTEFNLGTIYVSTRFNTFLWTGNVSIGDRGTRPFLGEACPSHVSYWWISNMGNMGFNGQWQSWDTSKKLPNEGCFSIYRSFLVRGFCENKCWECHGMSTEFLERKWQKKLELSQHLELFEVETDSEQSVSILNQPKRCKLKIVTPWRCFILSKEFYHAKIASKFGSKHPLMVWIHHRQNASSLSGTLAPRRISQVEPLRIAFGVQECRKLHLTPYLFAGHFDGQSSRNWATSLNSNLNESLIGSRLPFSFLDKSLQAKFIFEKKSPPGSQFRWTVPGTVSEEHDAQTNSTNLAPFAQRHPWVNSAGTTAGRKTSWV